MTARVESIFVGPSKGEPLVAVDEARVVVGHGLAGDRYAAHAGTFSKPREEADAGRDVTLIEAEAIDAALRERNVDLADGRSRRNLVTRGLSMRELAVNAYLAIGDDGVVLRVDRTCPPCRYLERLVPLSLEALRGRGGLRTTVARGGIVRAGDAITVCSRREVADRIGASHAF